jgi:hypothetical protein
VNGIPQWQSDRLVVLLDACTGAGLTVSAREQHLLSWLAGWEADTVEVIAGLIRRAGESGPAEGAARISHERLERYAGTLARDRDEAAALAEQFPARSATAKLYRESESTFRQALDYLNTWSEGAYGQSYAEQTAEVAQ